MNSINLNVIKEIKVGDHVCSIHEDHENALYVAAAFLKFGLENWEKCLYIGDNVILSRLEKIGVEKEYFESGQLSVVPEPMPENRISLLRKNLELAIEEGYRSLRVAQEMVPSDKLMEYEEELNEFYLKNPAIGLCQYVKNLFGAEALLRAVKTHPEVVAQGMVCANPLYFSPVEKEVEKELHAFLGLLACKTLKEKQLVECNIRAEEILKERTRKLQDSRDAIFNMLKDMDESYKKLQKAYQELQTLDKMKDEFISNVSHELKTPLISIKGYGELLFDEKLGCLSGEQKKSLEAIIRNADRLTRLINSILLIGRLHAGKIDFHFEPLDLDEIVRMCAGDFKSMMDAKQIILDKDVTGVSKVKGDKDKFVEVVSNLLDNSIKFTPVGGKIKIKAWDEAEYVHFTLSDNGIGIPADLIPKLFTRFFQVDASASRKYGGTGLGLYISKNIVDAFHGKIWIESEVGKGTTVNVLLPAAREMLPIGF
ncbi:MAG: ATP-binding protein [Candidatus Methanoperedens sp.]|nr:ATP-binding protein [Candidatus Methanoperedens sp.]